MPQVVPASIRSTRSERSPSCSRAGRPLVSASGRPRPRPATVGGIAPRPFIELTSATPPGSTRTGCEPGPRSVPPRSHRTAVRALLRTRLLLGPTIREPFRGPQVGSQQQQCGSSRTAPRTAVAGGSAPWWPPRCRMSGPANVPPPTDCLPVSAEGPAPPPPSLAPHRDRPAGPQSGMPVEESPADQPQVRSAPDRRASSRREPALTGSRHPCQTNATVSRPGHWTANGALWHRRPHHPNTSFGSRAARHPVAPSALGVPVPEPAVRCAGPAAVLASSLASRVPPGLHLRRRLPSRDAPRPGPARMPRASTSRVCGRAHAGSDSRSARRQERDQAQRPRRVRRARLPITTRPDLAGHQEISIRTAGLPRRRAREAGGPSANATCLAAPHRVPLVGQRHHTAGAPYRRPAALAIRPPSPGWRALECLPLARADGRPAAPAYPSRWIADQRNRARFLGLARVSGRGSACSVAACLGGTASRSTSAKLPA